MKNNYYVTKGKLSKGEFTKEFTEDLARELNDLYKVTGLSDSYKKGEFARNTRLLQMVQDKFEEVWYVFNRKTGLIKRVNQEYDTEDNYYVLNVWKILEDISLQEKETTINKTYLMEKYIPQKVEPIFKKAILDFNGVQKSYTKGTQILRTKIVEELQQIAKKDKKLGITNWTIVSNYGTETENKFKSINELDESVKKFKFRGHNGFGYCIKEYTFSQKEDTFEIVNVVNK